MPKEMMLGHHCNIALRSTAMLTTRYFKVWERYLVLKGMHALKTKLVHISFTLVSISNAHSQNDDIFSYSISLFFHSPGYYNPRALPSSGGMEFLQSFVCNLDNQCLNEPSSRKTFRDSRYVL